MSVLPDVSDGRERVERLAPHARTATVLEGPRVRIVDVGETAPRVSLRRARLEELVRAALALSEKTTSYVWVDGDSELTGKALRTAVADLVAQLDALYDDTRTPVVCEADDGTGTTPLNRLAGISNNCQHGWNGRLSDSAQGV